jgi:dihydroneopterin aldolase
MASVIKIELKRLRFFAFHGIHAEEKLIGNEFEVNVIATYLAPPEIIHSINDTVDYSKMFSIVKEQMSIPRELLETLAMETVEKIHTAFPQLKSVSYSILKLNPPIPHLTGSVSVNYTAEF